VDPSFARKNPPAMELAHPETDGSLSASLGGSKSSDRCMDTGVSRVREPAQTDMARVAGKRKEEARGEERAWRHSMMDRWQ
jgi:hypothetical protein